MADLEDVRLDDVVLDSAGLDFAELLAEWQWLLDEGEYTPLMVNAFGDVFLIDDAETVWLLQAEMGEITEVASSVEELNRKLATRESYEEWFSPLLLSILRSEGILLEEGECYGFREPLVLGGAPDLANLEAVDLAAYLASRGRLYRKLDEEAEAEGSGEGVEPVDFEDGDEPEIDGLEDLLAHPHAAAGLPRHTHATKSTSGGSPPSWRRRLQIWPR